MSSLEPEFTIRLSTGKQLLDLALGCYATLYNYQEIPSDEETYLIGRFLQMVTDLLDMADDMEPLARMETANAVTSDIQELEEKGWLIFGMHGEYEVAGSTIPALYLNILRHDNPEIVKLDMTKLVNSQ